MTFLNVVIGYGIIASVMTTDIDLSKEVIGWHDPLAGGGERAAVAVHLGNRCRHTLLRQLRTPGQRVKNVLIGARTDCLGTHPPARLRQHDVGAIRKWICRAMAG